MLAFALPYTLHVLAALVWVGGMFFAWLVLRPATVAALEGPARLRLWVEVFRRFFGWVWLAVAILAISGIGMLHMRFSGFETAPRYVHVMIGGGIAMFALFMRIQALLLPELKAAVQAEDWPTGAAVLGRIRRMVGSICCWGWQWLRWPVRDWSSDRRCVQPAAKPVPRCMTPALPVFVGKPAPARDRSEHQRRWKISSHAAPPADGEWT